MTRHFRSLLAAASIAAFTLVSLPAAAATIAADFFNRNGVTSATSGGRIEFSLNANGTISAILTAANAIRGFGVDSVSQHVESGFSSQISNPFGWASATGLYITGFATPSGLEPLSMSWTIGNVGEFDDVWDIAAGSGASFDVFLLDVTTDGRWVANLSAVSAAVPLPAGAPLLLAGLGALGVIARRRKA